VLGVIAAETLTHRDGPGGELVAQNWNVQWAAATAMAPRSVRLHLWEFYADMRRMNDKS
jgi:hypothetical protein